mmetsp:Transcript_24438/g.44547  ORF Transcript_24438/g.44547 Transcript_24438/m.44547 type:complete len:223 (-) Transcript_24438:488-1156(-)
MPRPGAGRRRRSERGGPAGADGGGHPGPEGLAAHRGLLRRVHGARAGQRDARAGVHERRHPRGPRQGQGAGGRAHAGDGGGERAAGAARAARQAPDPPGHQALQHPAGPRREREDLGLRHRPRGGLGPGLHAGGHLPVHEPRAHPGAALQLQQRHLEPGAGGGHPGPGQDAAARQVLGAGHGRHRARAARAAPRPVLRGAARLRGRLPEQGRRPKARGRPAA